MISEFKDFAAGGNLVDIAVGFVMGGAFATVVKSFIADLIMPIVSSVFSLPDFSQLYVALTETATAKAGMGLTAFREAGGSALAWGNFVNNLLAFLILAFVLFMIVKGVNKVKKAAEEATPANEVLLAEIRDLLKK